MQGRQGGGVGSVRTRQQHVVHGLRVGCWAEHKLVWQDVNFGDLATLTDGFSGVSALASVLYVFVLAATLYFFCIFTEDLDSFCVNACTM